MTEKKKHYSLNPNESPENSDDSIQNESTKSPVLKSNRRSKRLNKNTSKNSGRRISNEDATASTANKKSVKKSDAKILTNLKNVIHEAFHYTLKDVDLEFLKNIFTGLPTLDETWNRIGFNQETQNTRIHNLYDKINEYFSDILDGEEELETDILESIDSKTKKAKKYSIELGFKFDDSKLSKLSTILVKEDWIKKELARLEIERDRRLDELNELTNIEKKLCQKLKLKTFDLIRTIPSLDDLSQFATRIKDLEKLAEQRKHEMNKLRDEITKLYQDLDVSRSDSFVEGIIYDSCEELPLSEEDIARAKEVCEYLQQKDASLTSEIRSIRIKIKELWQKLNIENNTTLKNFIIASPAELNLNQLDIELKKLKKNKQQLADALQAEYDECIKIKMQNMQKFIDTVRVEIKKLCVLMFFGPREMKKLNDDFLESIDYTEDLLLRHEEKLEDLKFRYEESASLYEKTAKWMQMWDDFVKFEEITKDPTRLTKRGYSTLDESKKRSAFEKQLPKLVSEIAELAEEYEKMNGGTSFMIHDLFYSEYIERKKYDHEESKQNERKEKQIMKDQIKKNESKFGVSKIKTPLRAKRKITNNNITSMQRGDQDTLMQTPGRMRHSKMLKTDVSSVCGTPGLSSTRSTVLSSASLKPKLTVYDKVKGRKSKTPRKSTRKSLIKRKSRQLKSNQVNTESNDTLISDTTMKTTIVSSFASSNTTRSNLTNTTNTSSMTTSSSKYHFGHGLQASRSKCPPLSSSSKYVANSLQVMTSTASNSMIDEENFEDIENIDHSVINTKKFQTDRSKLLAEATAKINKRGELSAAAAAAGTKFNFRLQPSHLKYDEFSRDLTKTNNFQ